MNKFFNKRKKYTLTLFARFVKFIKFKKVKRNMKDKNLFSSKTSDETKVYTGIQVTNSQHHVFY